MAKQILIVPSIIKGNGSGHLMRCITLARELGKGAVLLIQEIQNSVTFSLAEITLAYGRELGDIKIITDIDPGSHWDLIVLDKRQTFSEHIDFWLALGPVVAIDEGGSARSSMSYLVDILPRAPARFKFLQRRNDHANKTSLSFLNLPQKRRQAPQHCKKILISFGGEDYADLALTMAYTLIEEKLATPLDLTIVNGALRREHAMIAGATILGAVQNLKEKLAEYDLVITQFGLTAYEAAFAGCAVLLYNPSPYHEKLSSTAGFASVGAVKIDRELLRKYFADTALLVSLTHKASPLARESLTAFVGGMQAQRASGCPNCASHSRRAIYRDEHKTYFRCKECALLYLEYFNLNDSELHSKKTMYTQSYFFEEYKKQYGKTYLEDWPNLQNYARGRIAHIEKLAAKYHSIKSLRILDVGCALGAFLDYAKSRGHIVVGTDISEEAIDYVRKELKIDAIAGDFASANSSFSFGYEQFDVLCMWFVIEHFTQLNQLLLRVTNTLAQHGIFAFSTPSGQGISARSDRENFLRASPADHFTIWEPRLIRKILKQYGLTVLKIVSTGHHPERFPLYKKITARSSNATLAKIAYAVLLSFSKIFKLGDSFEVYAHKSGKPDLTGTAQRKQAKKMTARSGV